MLANIIGGILIIMGIIFLFKPLALKQKLIKKSTKTIKRYLFAIALIVGIFLISSAWEYHGIIAIIITVIGVISIIKAFVFLKAGIVEKLVSFIEKQGITFFRVYAILLIIIGILIIFGLHHSAASITY